MPDGRRRDPAVLKLERRRGQGGNLPPDVTVVNIQTFATEIA